MSDPNQELSLALFESHYDAMAKIIEEHTKQINERQQVVDRCIAMLANPLLTIAERNRITEDAIKLIGGEDD